MSSTGFDMLDELDLSQNRLVSMDKHLFRPLIKLERVNLSRNELTIMHMDTFENLSSLKRVLLHENPICLLYPKYVRQLVNNENVIEF